jgi:superfamily II DNA or RNA helicase
MTIALRPYQTELKTKVFIEWQAGRPNVVMRLDTGGGKTRIFASIIEEHLGSSCLIAHRTEIVSQISLALAVCGVRHNIIADKKMCRAIADLHIAETGRSYYDPGARCAVASVDTLVRREGLEAWAAQVTLWIVDEGHHLVEDNKWHRAIALFTNPNCRGLLPTATPKRADGRGLGRRTAVMTPKAGKLTYEQFIADGWSDVGLIEAAYMLPSLNGDGVADCMVEGPPMRWLIEEGYLTDYDVICADSHLTELLGEVGKSGDWSTAQLKAAADASPIVGDVVKTYQKLNSGYYRGHEARPARTGIAFAPDVGTATKMLEAYRRAGIKAELVTGDTDPGVRRQVFKSLERGTVHMVIAVDIVSEGTDIPALIVGQFGRATASLAVYMQQLGRLLRPIYAPGFDLTTREGRLAAIAASIKPIAIIIDHVGNFMRHGPPDRVRQWPLASTGRKSGPSDAIPMRACLNPECGHPYFRHLLECPYCCTPAPEPAGRSSPSMVEGDMTQLDPEVLRALRGMVEEAVMSVDSYRAALAAKGAKHMWIMANVKHHDAKLKAREAVCLVMDRWGGHQRAAGLSDREMQKLFWYKFGIDVLHAQTLEEDDAKALMKRIEEDFP